MGGDQRGDEAKGDGPPQSDRRPGAGGAADGGGGEVLRGYPPANLRHPGRPGTGAQDPPGTSHRVVRGRGDGLRACWGSPEEDRGASRGLFAVRSVGQFKALSYQPSAFSRNYVSLGSVVLHLVLTADC